MLLIPTSSLIPSVSDTLNHALSLPRHLHQALHARSKTSKRVNYVTDTQLDSCPGYDAVDVRTTAFSLEADLNIHGGKGCGVYGPDLKALKLRVVYETSEY